MLSQEPYTKNVSTSLPPQKCRHELLYSTVMLQQAGCHINVSVLPQERRYTILLLVSHKIAAMHTTHARKMAASPGGYFLLPKLAVRSNDNKMSTKSTRCPYPTHTTVLSLPERLNVDSRTMPTTHVTHVRSVWPGLGAASGLSRCSPLFRPSKIGEYYGGVCLNWLERVHPL